MRTTTKSTTAPQIYNRVRVREKLPISTKEFIAMYKLFMSRVADRIIDGERFQTGCLGSIYVSSVNKKKKMIDWGSTGKMWKEHPETKERSQVVYYMSDHLLYTFIWSRGSMHKFYPKNMYRIRVCKEWRQKLKDAITVEHREYL